MQMTLSQHANDQYLLNNAKYRANLARKLGPMNAPSPTFQGGGLANCDTFLLPEISRDTVREQLRRLRSNNFEKHQVYKNSVKSAQWDEEFVKALEKFRDVNQEKPNKLSITSTNIVKPLDKQQQNKLNYGSEENRQQ